MSEQQLAHLKSDLIHVRRFASPFNGFLSATLFTGEQMYQYIDERNLPLWVMTYTVTTKNFIGVPVQKLIFSLGASKITNRRELHNIHSKLFILFDDDTPVCAFVGSQNLVAPTTENLMVLVKDQHDVRELVAYFNHFWRQAKPLSTTPVEQQKPIKIK